MKSERFFEGCPAPAPTLAPPMTQQTIFDRVVRHYRKQRRRCPVEGQCFYRLGGDMCFASSLIDSTHYVPDMEGHPVRDVIKAFTAPAWFRDNISFIEKLQTIHDTKTNWLGDRMETILKMFAADHGLRMPS